MKGKANSLGIPNKENLFLGPPCFYIQNYLDAPCIYCSACSVFISIPRLCRYSLQGEHKGSQPVGREESHLLPGIRLTHEPQRKF